MDLKDYREMPDKGLFGKIERRLRLRHMMRTGGVALAVLVAGGAAWLLLSQPTEPAPAVSAEASQPSRAEIQKSDHLPAGAGFQDLAKREDKTDHQEAAVPSSSKPTSKEVSAIPMAASSPAGAAMAAPELPVANVEPAQVAVDELIVDNERVDNPTAVQTTAPKAGTPGQQAPAAENILWAPNAIAPTADVDDANRIFKVYSNTQVSDFRMVVYNRGGRQVFTTNDINQGWDATFGGSLVPQGTYMWVARFRDSDGNLRQEKGSITVLR